LDLRSGSSGSTEAATPTVAEIYATHGDFLWKSLHRMGVPEADLPDAMQELLLVAHRRISTYDGRAKLTTWLFGIGLRVAATTRRKVRRRRETDLDEATELETTTHRELDGADAVERRVVERDAERRLNEALESLHPEQRALFVLYEVEQRPCSEIAELLGVPLGTVHSRLHTVRELFFAALARIEKRERARTGGRG
jgi:RNA polymerase sigma-70 factor (ECF subfamily)